MKLQLNPATTPFNLAQTLTCGQSFRWRKLGAWWAGIVHEKVVKIRQADGTLNYQTIPEESDSRFIESYFRLDDDLPEIISQISSDDCIRRAVRSCTGLRIIRQQPWECLISYICATHKNIPAIKNVISNLSKEFGRRVTFDQHDFYTFPKPSALAKASIEQLKACKLGFRADRVRETARIIHEQQLDLESLREASYESARATLRSLPGVGPKVADCVLLFSLDKLEAFPVDVWMRRAILEYYSDHFPPAFIERMKEKGSCTPRDYREIRLFGQTYFGRYAGYAQEYLFAMIRRQWTTKETSISMRRPYK